MLKKTFRDGFIYTLSTILSRGISLILLPLYTRYLTPTDYGTVDLLNVLATLVHLTIALEIAQAIARFFPEAETEKDKVGYASTALWFTIGVYSVLLILGIIFARQLSALVLDTPLRHDVIYIALLNVWLTGLLYRSQGQLRFQLRSLAYAVVSLIQLLATALATVILLVVFRLDLYAVLFGQGIGAVCALAISLYLTRNVHRATFSSQLLRTMLVFSIPLVPSSLGVFVTTYLDRVMIKEMMTIADVGLYGLAVRLSSIISLAFVGFQVGLTPLIYKHYKEPGTPAALAQLSRYVAAVSLLLFIVLAVFAREIVALVATETYEGAAAALPTLVFATLVSQLYILAPGLSIAKDTRKYAVINIAGAVLNTILNFILIPTLGIQGAAVATLISAAMTFAILMRYSQKLYYVPHNWGQYVAVFGIIVVVFFASQALPLTPSAVAVKLVMCSAVIAAIIGFRLIRPDELTSAVWSVRRKLATSAKE